MKTVFVFQDLCLTGAVSLGVQWPVLSRMGHRVVPLPTGIFSNNFAYPHVLSLDCAAFSAGLPAALHETGVVADAFFVGAVPSPALFDGVLAFLDSTPHIPLFVDPVMADHGKMYRFASDETLAFMRKLCQRALCFFPNATEAALLMGERLDGATDPRALADGLSALYKTRFVITGVKEGDTIANYAVDGANASATRIASPRRDRDYAGTGDLFSALVTGQMLQGDSLCPAVRHACAFIERAFDLTPVKQDPRLGLCFERVDI